MSDTAWHRDCEISSLLMEGDVNAVDIDKGILRNVKMCGTISPTNRRHWPAHVLAAAKDRYEGSACYVDHDKGSRDPGSRKPRSYNDRLGNFRNVVAKENGLYGDLHFNPEHRSAKAFAWDVKNKTEGVGFSHDVDWRYKRHADGIKEALEVGRVYSVDLVSGPGTTKNVFESADDEEDTDQGADEVATEQELADLKARLLKLEGEKTALEQEKLTAERLVNATTWAAELGLEGEAATEAAGIVAGIADDKLRGLVTGLVESVVEAAANSQPAPGEQAGDFDEALEDEFDEEPPVERKVQHRRSGFARPRSREALPATEAGAVGRKKVVAHEPDGKAAVARWRSRR